MHIEVKAASLRVGIKYGHLEVCFDIHSQSDHSFPLDYLLILNSAAPFGLGTSFLNRNIWRSRNCSYLSNIFYCGKEKYWKPLLWMTLLNRAIWRCVSTFALNQIALLRWTICWILRDVWIGNFVRCYGTFEKSRRKRSGKTTTHVAVRSCVCLQINRIFDSRAHSWVLTSTFAWDHMLGNLCVACFWAHSTLKMIPVRCRGVVFMLLCAAMLPTAADFGCNENYCLILWWKHVEERIQIIIMGVNRCFCAFISG